MFRGAVRGIRISERTDEPHGLGLYERALAGYRQVLGQFADAYCIQSRLAVWLMERWSRAASEVGDLVIRLRRDVAVEGPSRPLKSLCDADSRAVVDESDADPAYVAQKEEIPIDRDDSEPDGDCSGSDPHVVLADRLAGITHR